MRATKDEKSEPLHYKPEIRFQLLLLELFQKVIRPEVELFKLEMKKLLIS